MYILKLLKTNKLKSYVQKQILLATYKFVLCSETEAKVTLTSIWGDNMVLQQQAEVTFRGKATPGKRVYASASWNHRKIFCRL